jgi:hypothetical protein
MKNFEENIESEISNTLKMLEAYKNGDTNLSDFPDSPERNMILSGRKPADWEYVKKSLNEWRNYQSENHEKIKLERLENISKLKKKLDSLENINDKLDIITEILDYSDLPEAKEILSEHKGLLVLIKNKN